MEKRKRKHKRYQAYQSALIAGKPGFVNDVSNDGMGIFTSIIPRTRRIEISIELEDRMLLLEGMVQWIRRKNTKNPLNRLGIFLQDPPPVYYEYVSGLDN